MQCFYDLHIHSALSPCGDNDMTPNNVVNMAVLNGLDFIALTDHNAADNLPAFDSVARKAGLIFVPGIELNTAEEVHLLAYFDSVEKACLFGDMIYDALPDIKNNRDYFGAQLVMDENDNVVAEKEKLLLSALPFSFEECLDYINEYGGVPVPAHINKDANSILNNLGFIPENSMLGVVEYRPEIPLVKEDRFRYLTSSDAHYLGNISDREFCVDTAHKTLKGIIDFLR